MKYYLIVAKGSKKGMPIEINVDLFLIGSEKMCQLRKFGLGMKHCAVVSREKKVFIRDMDSGQSTLVNNQVLPPGEEWPLHAGDIIGVGPLEFLVNFREKALSGKDLEEWAMTSLDTIDDPVEEYDEFGRYNTAATAAASIINQLNAMKGVVKGRLRVGVDRGALIVRFNDAMLVEEAEISMIKRELCDSINKPNLRVLLDLKNVRRMSTSAVMMLSDVYRWMRPRGCTLAICRIRREIESAMGLMQVENVPTFPDKRTALAAKW